MIVENEKVKVWINIPSSYHFALLKVSMLFTLTMCLVGHMEKVWIGRSWNHVMILWQRGHHSCDYSLWSINLFKCHNDCFAPLNNNLGFISMLPHVWTFSHTLYSSSSNWLSWATSCIASFLMKNGVYSGTNPFLNNIRVANWTRACSRKTSGP